MKFRHLGIVVRDLDESLDFYINKLGLSVAVDNIEEGSFIDEILGFVDCKVRTIKLQYGNTQIVELLYYFNPESKDLSKSLNYVGCTHFALTIDNLNELYHKLVIEKVEFVNKPKISDNGKAKVVFCKDPNDVYLELVEEL